MKNAGHPGVKTSFLGGRRCPLFVLLLGLFCLLAPATGWSQSANRWLFIFNTSAAMRSRVQNIEAVAADLLSTGMHGNMRPGDTIGIWTYDSQLRSDEAPLQTWDPDYERAIIQNTLGFLDRHRYAGPAAFDDVMANILHVTKISDTITIILVSDGSDPMKGTPFDASINSFYKTNYNAQKKADMPVVTVFRGESGKMTAFTDNLAPWPVDIPKTPPPKVAKATPPKPAPPKAAAPVVPSLVMIGKKSETVLHPLADYAPPATPPPPPVEQKPAAQTPPASPETAPVSKPASDAKPSAEPAAPQSSPPPPAVSEHSNAPAVVETPKTVESAPAGTESAPQAGPAKNVAADLAQPNVETGVAPAPHELFSPRNIAIISGAFVVIICGLLWATRRSRRATGASLITRSLDREQR